MSDFSIYPQFSRYSWIRVWFGVERVDMKLLDFLKKSPLAANTACAVIIRYTRIASRNIS